jgi:NAD-dependent deacetylase
MQLVVLSGAGMSAESGIPTFRGAGGLWENHRIEDVATPGAFIRDPALVLRFYNERRKQIKSVEPNKGHFDLVKMEQDHRVTVITQNIDDLHERAGSTNVIHLHGEIFKSRSSKNENLVYDCPGDICIGDFCELGSQLRPHIVWFGELVPMMEVAAAIVAGADALIVIGTSMAVYPAASLVQYTAPSTPVYIINPEKPEMTYRQNYSFIQQPATTGVETVAELLKQTTWI